MIGRATLGYALAAALMPIAAAPGAGWSPPVTLGGDEARTPRVAMTPSGEAIVAWGPKLDSDAATQVAIRPPGGVFGSPQTLAGSSFYVDFLAADDDGNATAVWSEGPPWAIRSMFASRPAGGVFSPGAPWPFAAQPQELVAVRGGAVALWNDGAGAIVAARWDGVAWGEPRRVAEAAGRPVAAADPDGRLTVAWIQRDPDDHTPAPAPGGPSRIGARSVVYAVTGSMKGGSRRRGCSRIRTVPWPSTPRT